MKYLARLLVVTLALVAFAGCGKADTRQRDLFAKASLVRADARSEAMVLYAEAEKIDPTSELGRAAHERIIALRKAEAEARAALQKSVTDQVNQEESR